jgi:dipeptidyl aminopeptidase/acylaminoacyl peptidase
MNTPSRIAMTAACLATGLGYAALGLSKPPPPPPPPYAPQILYTEGSKGGSTTSIYVANADGTDAVSLYSTGNITSGVKFAPTGDRIVFVEQNAIKVLTFAVSSQGVTTTSVTTLTTEQYRPWQVDVSPDGTQLLFAEDTAIPNQRAIYTMSMSGGSGTMLINMPPGSSNYAAVWANSNNRIAVLQGAPAQPSYGVQTIQVVDLDASYNVLTITSVFNSTVSQLYEIQRIESAHTSNTLVFGATSGSNANVYALDIGTMAVSAPIVAGSNASFSADDSTLLFVGPTTPILYEFNRNTNTQTLINSPRLFAQPDFLP